jgi:serine/threonine-protein kinase
MAPEQAAADPSTDHRADIYSLGVVGYEMLAGVPPFHGRSQHELLRAQLTEVPQPISSRRYDVPVALAKLIMQCLEKNPDARPRNATEAVRVLESSEAVSGEFAAPGAVGRTMLLSRRTSWILTGSVLAAAIVWYYMLPGLKAAPGDARPFVEMTWLEPIGLQRDSAVSHVLTTDLAYALAAVREVRVAQSVDAFALVPADSTRGPSAMRVTGTVQREGDRVRVNLRVSRIASDSTLWTGRFEGKSSDLLALEDEIATATTEEVRRIAGPPS